jgi:ferredoxin
MKETLAKAAIHVEMNGCFYPAEKGENLRTVMLRHNLSLYNDKAEWLNCRGLGTCGTCAVVVEGKVSEPTKVEWCRLGVYPHRHQPNLRLACQTKIIGPVKLKKGRGFWGQFVSDGHGK